ncbi:hypothetical protein [Paenibacillus bovis]|uniref:Uncharacterized protein n=1 Tax=Paenibacillus bovis TaxID=1616788 RepID=A0A172ZD45_9BACL|nr:hypothetical protein [Paenibacillus bovis]ANF95581.1 hypothetical protein AR543_05895 [Paenibacillus bovis]
MIDVRVDEIKNQRYSLLILLKITVLQIKTKPDSSKPYNLNSNSQIRNLFKTEISILWTASGYLEVGVLCAPSGGNGIVQEGAFAG